MNTIEVQRYESNRVGFFGKPITIIIEATKKKLNNVLVAYLNNGLYSKRFGEIHLFQLKDGVKVLSKNSEETKIDKKGFEYSIDKAVMMLTKEIQLYFLQIEIDIIVNGLKEKGLEPLVYTEENGPNIEYVITDNKGNKMRNIIIYVEKGDSQYDFVDLKMSQDEIEEQFKEIDLFDIDQIEKWLRGESLID